MSLNQRDKAAIRRWALEIKAIRKATLINPDETSTDQEARIDRLLADPIAFCRYYFPHYATSDFSDFQEKAINEIASKDIIYAALEWARGHAKSSTVVPMLVLYLTFKEKDVNLLLVSYNETNAIDLLTPLRLELENNQRIIHDFGTQKGLVQWEAKKFVTTGGCSFRAIGTGQSPRGTKNEEVRPNIIIVDDADEDEMLRNPKRLDQAWEWLSGALYNCFDIQGKKRFVVINNRIAKDSIIGRASLQADYHSQVNAIRKIRTKKEQAVADAEIKLLRRHLKKETNDKTRKVMDDAIKLLLDGYIPSWYQRYSMQQIAYVKDKIGSLMFDREYMNKPTTVGKIFNADWFQYKKLPPLSQYNGFMVGYLDPSFKAKKTSDSKSWVLVGLWRSEYHIIKAFCDRATIDAMIDWGYDLHDIMTKGNAAGRLYMEEVFLQDLLYKDFAAVAKKKKYPLPLIGDKRKKPDKDARIASMQGYFERGSVYFNEAEKDNHHTSNLQTQLLVFEPGVNTLKDGPDALEGAIHLLNTMMGGDASNIASGPSRSSKHKL